MSTKKIMVSRKSVFSTLMLAGLSMIAVVLFLVYEFMGTNKPEKASNPQSLAQVQALPSEGKNGSQVATDSTNYDPAYKAALNQVDNQEFEQAVENGDAARVPTFGPAQASNIDEDAASQPMTPSPQYFDLNTETYANADKSSDKVNNQDNKPKKVDPKTRQALREEWGTLEPSGIEQGESVAAFSLRPTTTEDVSKTYTEESQQIKDNQLIKIPLLKQLPALLMTGVNSDYPGVVIAQLWTRAYPGVRLAGQVTTGQYNEKAVLRFNSMVDKDGKLYRCDAIAVSPDKLIPAIDGRVNHHVLRNLTFVWGSALLQGLAGYSSTANLYNNITSLGAVKQTTSGLAIKSGVGALQQSLQNRGLYRNPTLTLRPGDTEIALIFLSQPTLQTAQQAFNNQTSGGERQTSAIQVNDQTTQFLALQKQLEGIN